MVKLFNVHQKHKPLQLSIEHVMFISTESIKSPCPADNRILTSNNLFDMYYFLNKDINNYTNTFKCMVDDFIPLQFSKFLSKESMMINKVILVSFVQFFSLIALSLWLNVIN